MRLSKMLSSNPVKGALLFAIAGPPIGSFLVTMTIALPFAIRLTIHKSFLMAAMVLFIPIGVAAFSFLFGAIPAALSGIVVGILRTRLSPFSGAIISGAVAALITLFFFAFLMSPPGIPDIQNALEDSPDTLALFGLFAFVGGFIVGHLFLKHQGN